jgi:hypothetical protein
VGQGEVVTTTIIKLDRRGPPVRFLTPFPLVCDDDDKWPHFNSWRFFLFASFILFAAFFFKRWDCIRICILYSRVLSGIARCGQARARARGLPFSFQLDCPGGLILPPPSIPLTALSAG